MTPRKLAALLDRYLDVDAVVDYCPNGLQVEGRRNISKIVTGVSACRALFESAEEKNADAVLVHHGLLWNGPEAACITGVLARRIRMLFDSGMSLLAYHLPLDRHMEVGNAAVMARELGMTNLEAFARHRGVGIGVRGIFNEPISLEEILERITTTCRREPEVFGPSDGRIRSLGIVTGAAEREYHQAVAEGLDAFITGEVSEWVVHQALEEGVPFISAGHHATERFGIGALGRWIENNHDIEVEFVDIPNPV